MASSRCSMATKEMIIRLDEADSLIIQVYYKLKQSGDEKVAAGKLFEASVKVQEAIEIIEEKISRDN